MRSRWLGALLLCAVVLIALLVPRRGRETLSPGMGASGLQQEQTPPPHLAMQPGVIPPAAPAAPQSAATPFIPTQMPAAAGAPGATPLQAGGPEPEQDTGPPLAAETAAEAVRSAVQKYGETFGGNPVGTNAEITRALNGDNPTHSLFLSGIPGQHINSNGELTDPWGTPYFFHQLSGHDMEVRSAGPDRTMWTSDDIVIK